MTGTFRNVCVRVPCGNEEHPVESFRARVAQHVAPFRRLRELAHA